VPLAGAGHNAAMVFAVAHRPLASGPVVFAGHVAGTVVVVVLVHCPWELGGPVVPDGHSASTVVVVVTSHVGSVAALPSGHVAGVVVVLSHC
jgi:hypothetical protein